MELSIISFGDIKSIINFGDIKMWYCRWPGKQYRTWSDCIDVQASLAKANYFWFLQSKGYNTAWSDWKLLAAKWTMNWITEQVHGRKLLGFFNYKGKIIKNCWLNCTAFFSFDFCYVLTLTCTMLNFLNGIVHFTFLALSIIF